MTSEVCLSVDRSLQGGDVMCYPYDPCVSEPRKD